MRLFQETIPLSRLIRHAGDTEDTFSTYDRVLTGVKCITVNVAVYAVRVAPGVVLWRRGILDGVMKKMVLVICFFVCRLRSIATHRDHFVRLSVTLFCHTFQSYVLQATHGFLGMLPLFFNNWMAKLRCNRHGECSSICDAICDKTGVVSEVVLWGRLGGP